MTFYSRKVSVNPVSKKPDSDICGPCYQYPPPYPAKHPIPAALVLSLGFAGAALLILSYLALRRCVMRQPRSPPPPAYYNNREEFDRGPVVDHPIWLIRTTGLPRPVIESIQPLSYKKGEGLIGTSDCSVCLSEFEDGESLRLLPKCGHAFHVACIDTWLGSHTNCPLCRAPVLAATGGQLSGVESGSSLSTYDGQEGNEGIEIREIVFGGEMEPMRRSVSLDFSSAVDANKAFAFPVKRSISISGPSVGCPYHSCVFVLCYFGSHGG